VDTIGGDRKMKRMEFPDIRAGLDGPSRTIKVDPVRRTEPAREPARETPAPERVPSAPPEKAPEKVPA
jgi:hypothetical protein